MAFDILTSLRDARRPVARLTLAIMILPLWLSLMATVSPAASQLLGGKAGQVFVICTASGLKAIASGEAPSETTSRSDCVACHTFGCSAASMLSPSQLATIIPDALARVPGDLGPYAVAARAQAPPGNLGSRAPPATS
ncbi:MAG: hypothetical protein AAF638_10155 [Pseudomonadota bacterium]